MNAARSRQWVLASGNAGKLREFGQRFADLGVTLTPQSDYGVNGVEETGTTCVENALLKARAAALAAGRPALADDSGLQVRALDGRPGIHSARFAGEDASDAANNQRLLDELSGVTDRVARFCCVLVWLRSADDPLPVIAQATWSGVILEAPQGQSGFGYDPLFYLPNAGCTSAELSPAEKNRRSHRGQAIDQLLALLRVT